MQKSQRRGSTFKYSNKNRDQSYFWCSVLFKENLPISCCEPQIFTTSELLESTRDLFEWQRIPKGIWCGDEHWHFERVWKCFSGRYDILVCAQILKLCVSWESQRAQRMCNSDTCKSFLTRQFLHQQLDAYDALVRKKPAHMKVFVGPLSFRTLKGPKRFWSDIKWIDFDFIGIRPRTLEIETRRRQHLHDTTFPCNCNHNCKDERDQENAPNSLHLSQFAVENFSPRFHNHVRKK